ncbi:MAG: phosphatidate cytidylyltransferase [Alphaproteobacteria bacterium]
MTQQQNGCDDRLDRRLASVLVIVPLALAVTLAGPLVFAAFVALALLVLVGEWSELVCRDVGRQSASRVLSLHAVLAIALGFVGQPALGLAVGLGGGIMAGLVIAGDRGRWFVAGAVYLIAPGVASVFVRGGPDGLIHMLWLFAVVWSTDTGAYLAGRLIGGPLIAPSFSPNKTWAGLLGGWTIGGAVGIAVGHAVSPVGPVALDGLAVVAALVSGATQLGDMGESALKRHFGVKDTGSLLPGHGGLLDRLDGFLIAVMILAASVAFGWRL